MSYGMFGSMVPIFAKEDVGATYDELAWIGAIYFVPYMFVPLLIGFLLIRYNNAYLLVLGAVITTVSIYLLSTAESVTEITIYRMATGLALAMFWPSCQAIISHISKESDRIKNLARLLMFYVIGFMIGPLIGNVLVENDIGYRMLFQLSAVVMAVTIISVLTKSHAGVEKSHSVPIGMFKQFIKYPIVLVMTAYCTISFGAILAIYPAFMSDSGISDKEILLLYFVFGFARVATLAVSSRLSKRADLILISTAFAVSAGLSISYFSGSILGFGVAMLFLGFGFSIFFPFMMNLILSRNPRATAGALIGVYESIVGIGLVLGPMFAGYMSEWYGIELVYAALSVAGLSIGILAAIRRRSLVANPSRIE